MNEAHAPLSTASLSSLSPLSPMRVWLRAGVGGRARCLRPTCVACVATGCLIVVAACGSALPPIGVVAVDPPRAYNDAATKLHIQTHNLRVSLDIDLAGGALGTPIDADFALRSEVAPGQAAVPLGNLAALGDDLFEAEAPSMLAEGTYSLVVTDRHEPRSATETGAFESLGPDVYPPSFVAVIPKTGTHLQAGSSALADVTVDDGDGKVARVTWTTRVAEIDTGQPLLLSPHPLASVPVPGPGIGPPGPTSGAPPSNPTAWSGQFLVPTSPDPTMPIIPFQLVVTASDSANNPSTLTVDLWSDRLPTVVAFAPTEGSQAGGELFKISLQDFQPDDSVWIGGDPLVDQIVLQIVLQTMNPGFTTIVGRVPAHGRADAQPISVLTAAGRTPGLGRYLYVAPPLIRGIEPPSGRATGGIRLTVTGDALGPTVRLFIGNSASTGAAASAGITSGTGTGATVMGKRQVQILETFDPPDKLVACLPPGEGAVNLWAEDQVAGASAPGAIQFTYVPAWPVSRAALATDPADATACTP